MRRHLRTARLAAALCALAAPASAQNLLQNALFDTGIAPWTGGVHSALDALGLANSGSIEITNSLPAFQLVTAVSECFPVVPGSVYEGRFDYRLVTTPGVTGVVQVFPSWYSSATCSGFLGFGSTGQVQQGDGLWHTAPTLGAQLTAPPTAQSARIDLSVVKVQTGGTATANFDNVVFKKLGTCAPLPDVLCLNQGRFQVEADWDTVSASGRARTVQLTPDTGYLWFFHPNNVEVVIKVLDACSFNASHWVFAGGLTDQGVAITVTDTKTGVSKPYLNQRGDPFLPIQDTSAFLTCP